MASSFQYEITDGPEKSDPAFLEQVDQPFTGELTRLERADPALLDSGSSGAHFVSWLCAS